MTTVVLVKVMHSNLSLKTHTNTGVFRLLLVWTLQNKTKKKEIDVQFFCCFCIAKGPVPTLIKTQKKYLKIPYKSCRPVQVWSAYLSSFLFLTPIMSVVLTFLLFFGYRYTLLFIVSIYLLFFKINSIWFYNITRRAGLNESGWRTAPSAYVQIMLKHFIISTTICLAEKSKYAVAHKVGIFLSH